MKNFGCAVMIVICLCAIVLFLGSHATQSASTQPSKPSIADKVHLSMRGSAFDSTSGVVQIHNDSDETISATMYVYNEENQQNASFHVDLAPNVPFEIGWTYGWAFKPHEQIYLVSDKYDASRWDTSRMDDGGVGIKLKAR